MPGGGGVTHLPRVHDGVELRGQHRLHHVLPIGEDQAVPGLLGAGTSWLDLLDVEELDDGRPTCTLLDICSTAPAVSLRLHAPMNARPFEVEHMSARL